MNREPDDWGPSPELLAAYFDGELADRPDLVELRHRIANWLRSHPEARAVLDDYRRLTQLWRETTPPDPGDAAWNRLEADLRAVPLGLTGAPWRRLVVRWTAVLATVAAAIALAIWLSGARSGAPPLAQHTPPEAPMPAPIEIFPVATAAEVMILRVEGEDTQTLVVGELPLYGPLELAGPGEVALTSVQPAARDRMIPDVRIGGAGLPMIWARSAAETEP